MAKGPVILYGFSSSNGSLKVNIEYWVIFLTAADDVVVEGVNNFHQLS